MGKPAAMLLLMLLTQLAAHQVAAADFYTAAVVEYFAPHNPLLSADQVLLNNSAAFIGFMAQANASKVDIIVFPEDGLVGRYNRNKQMEVSAPTDNIAPCDHNTTYHPALVHLSCAARNFKMYTVINLNEKYYNTSDNKTEFYNSDVAFDRNGAVVGRYRKFNPYGEYVNKPAVADYHTFLTDFGVTFGMFTCFDIDFKEPAIVMATQLGVKHFILPLCWISELPFLTAIQTQWGWAYSLDVVLLAAGCNDPPTGGTGSGIYLGRRGPSQTIQTNKYTSKLIVSQVPISLNVSGIKDAASLTYSEPSNQMSLLDQSLLPEVHFLDEVASTKEFHQLVDTSQSNSTLSMLRDYLDVYHTLLLQPAKNCSTQPCSLQVNSSTTSVEATMTTDTTLCDNQFCCHFRIKMTDTFKGSPPVEMVRGDDFSRLSYRLVAFDGVRWYGGGIATGGVQVCGIISCVNDTLASCGLRADDPSRQPQTYLDSTFGKLYKTGTVFQSIIITANVSYNNTFVFPDILVTGSGDNYGALVSSDSFSYDSIGPFGGQLLSSLKILSPVPKLVTAALYARQFNRDGQNRTEATTSFAHPKPPSILMFCVLFLIVFHCIFSKIF